MYTTNTLWGNGCGRAQGECHHPLTECSLHPQSKNSGKMTTRSKPPVFADTHTWEPAAESTSRCIAVASLTFEPSLRTRSSQPKEACRFSTLGVGVDASAATTQKNQLRAAQTHWSCPTSKHGNRARDLQVHAAPPPRNCHVDVIQSTDLCVDTFHTVRGHRLISSLNQWDRKCQVEGLSGANFARVQHGDETEQHLSQT